jgi:cytochrome b pre-mRNA-processing protein 3
MQFGPGIPSPFAQPSSPLRSFDFVRPHPGLGPERVMQRVILRPSRPILTQLNARALRPYTSVQAPKPTPGPTKPYEHEKAPKHEPSWLTRKLRQSPIAMRAFLRVFGALGYGSARQIAARRALGLYEQLCSGRAEEDRRFWAEGAHDFLPFPSHPDFP